MSYWVFMCYVGLVKRDVDYDFVSVGA